MSKVVHICRFDSGAGDLRGKQLTYENIKRLVLEDGRFSVFEATASPKRARIYERLCRDPEIEIVEMPFPWTGVKRRDAGGQGDKP